MVPKTCGVYLLTGVSPQTQTVLNCHLVKGWVRGPSLSITIKTPAATVAEGDAPRKNEQRTLCPLAFLLRAHQLRLSITPIKCRALDLGSFSSASSNSWILKLRRTNDKNVLLWCQKLAGFICLLVSAPKTQTVLNCPPALMRVSMPMLTGFWC